MKKRIIAIIAALMMAAAPAMAQIFMTDEDLNNREGATQEQFGVMVPGQNLDYDQWKITPAGEGLVVLAGLAGAYLLGKRRKEE